MTLNEFRADGALVSQWRDVLKMPIVQLVLGIMAQEAPVHRLIKGDISPTFANIRLGHQSGWAEYEKTFTEALLVPPRNTEHLEPTYENPDDKKEE